MKRELTFLFALLGGAAVSCAGPPPAVLQSMDGADLGGASPADLEMEEQRPADLALSDLASSDLVSSDLASLDLAISASDLSPPDLSLPDLALPADGPSPPDPTACTVPLMTALYPGAGPPNPYGVLPAADACVAVRHDVIIVLGCPNQDSGPPAPCQTKRADIAVALMQAGFGDRFITTGGAVHNAYVEADTLKDLLVARGVPTAHITTETKASHTDENIYYSTLLMAAPGFHNALVVSDDPGHLILTAVCDSNCCVSMGRLTVLTLPIKLPGHPTPSPQAVGHYALYPRAAAVSPAECTFIESPLKFMCTNLKTRLSCAGHVMLP